MDENQVHITYQGQGFQACDKKTALGAIHSEPDKVTYWVQVGTMAEPRWEKATRDRYHHHLQA